ncbi:MAG: hypothetical protein IPL27_24145 [Lewinellaceae bacterium]|nr:hypothetical protein [Lewinellaceae bacterium]
MQFDLKGHTGLVTEARWSPDGTKVVTSGADGDAIIWSVLTANKLITLHHADPVTDARWSPDGAIIATLSKDISSDVVGNDRGTAYCTQWSYQSAKRHSMEPGRVEKLPP